MKLDFKPSCADNCCMGYYVETDGTVRSEKSVREETEENISKARPDSGSDNKERHSAPAAVEFTECSICHMKVPASRIRRHMNLHKKMAAARIP